jgi:hypothetical protein
MTTNARRAYLYGHLQMQGENHIERGQNFEIMLHSLGMSDVQTFDYVPGAGHDAEKMLFSKGGFDKASNWKSLS